MNVAFVLGNGFDLQLGMETGYKDFLKWYVNQPTEDVDIELFKDYLKDEKSEWWSDAEVAMGQYLGQFTDDNIHIYYKNIRDFKLRLAEYLAYQTLRYDIASEPQVIDAFRDFLLNSADDVMLRPGNFLLNERRKRADTRIGFVTFNYTDALYKILQKVEEKYPVLDSAPAGGGSYKTRIGEIYPVHGTLVSNLIMGVDNFSQLDCSNITITEKLRRTLLKPAVNDELGRNEHEKAKQLIKSSSILFFYGLSFGATDISWWEVIREKIISDAECQIVVFTRSSEDDIQEIIPEDVLDYVSDKKEEFLAQIGILTSDVNYEGVWKRVFIVRNTKRLPISIQEIKEPATT